MKLKNNTIKLLPMHVMPICWAGTVTFQFKGWKGQPALEPLHHSLSPPVH